jgi:hypothetical protein
MVLLLKNGKMADGSDWNRIDDISKLALSNPSIFKIYTD